MPSEQREPPRLSEAGWLIRPETKAVFAALKAGGVDARAVGGAVRNALMGLPVKDVDIATPAVPAVVIRLAEAAGLRAIPTGLQHGTVTIVSDHVPYEVTTLRRDVETDGRHAKVSFTDDWAEDARRRDFTINALYCGADGKVFDPLGGYPDLAAKRVRFIGDAHERIREDYLRILRFFRFTAEYTSERPDGEGLLACVAEKSGLKRISGERIRAEMLRLLKAPNAVRTVAVMAESGILSEFIAHPPHLPVLAKLAEIETASTRQADDVLRLAALTISRPGDALALKERLKLSNDEFERLARASMPDPSFDPKTGEVEARKFIYRYGDIAFSDGALLDWSRSADPVASPERRARLQIAAQWKPPLLPIRGSDLVALGVPEGPRVGHVMSAFETWWMDEDFPTDGERIKAEIKRLVMVH